MHIMIFAVAMTRRLLPLDWSFNDVSKNIAEFPEFLRSARITAAIV